MVNVGLRNTTEEVTGRRNEKRRFFPYATSPRAKSEKDFVRIAVYVYGASFFSLIKKATCNEDAWFNAAKSVMARSNQEMDDGPSVMIIIYQKSNISAFAVRYPVP
jgi:hypothetical protein